MVAPEESLIQRLICCEHTIRDAHIIEKSCLQETNANALIFAVVPAIASTDDNFNGAYSMDQAEALKERGNFSQAIYLTSMGIRMTLPTSFNALLAEVPNWPDELMAYITALEYYCANNAPSEGGGQLERNILGRRGWRQFEHLKQLHQQHAELIQSTIENAIINKLVPVDVANQLDTIGLIEATTEFRHVRLFPGECGMLRYEFEKAGERHMGYLGFDENKALISIDERLPAKHLLYRKGTAEQPEWTEI
ncbi:MAG: hypothetical protein NTV81_01715 [Candidatus Komeilibacteria bacterium]|nr:hypothetical protein [Candidatus Komeilibacteria bacterium]